MAYSKATKAKFAKLEQEIIEKDKTIAKLEYEYQDLNIKFKYTQFDIEATKREIEYLKKQLRDKD
jgi:peptidoglycan hydrolase CwlO-like protein